MRWLDICGSTRLSMTSPTKPNASLKFLIGYALARHLRSTRNGSESRKVCIWLVDLLVSSSLRPISSPVTNISAQSVTFLRHKTSLASDLCLASSTKYRTATPSATAWRLSAGISSRRQRSIGMISCNKFLSNPRFLYWQNHRGCPDIRPQTCHMSRHSLVQERHRFPAPAEVLHLWGHHSYLLLNGMENSVRWKQVHTPSRIKVCSYWRGSIGCGLWIGIRPSLRTRLRQLSGSYLPQAGTRGSQQPTPRRYQERKTTVTQGNDAAIPFLYNPLTRTETKGAECKVAEIHWWCKKLHLHSYLEESDSIACIEPRLQLLDATMTWEPDI